MKNEMKEIKYVVNDNVLDSETFDEFRSYLLENDIQFIYSEHHFFDSLDFTIACNRKHYEFFAVMSAKKALVEAGLIDANTKIDAL